MAGWLHGVFVVDWLFVFPLCGFSLSLFCNYLWCWKKLRNIACPVTLINKRAHGRTRPPGVELRGSRSAATEERGLGKQRVARRKQRVPMLLACCHDRTCAWCVVSGCASYAVRLGVCENGDGWLVAWGLCE